MKMVSIWRKGKHCTLLWECKRGQPLQHPVWRFLRNLKTELAYDSATAFPGIYPKKIRNTNRERYRHPNIYSSITYNCQDTEAT